MRVVVIGSGIVGVTSAYLLLRLGHEVVVIDREDEPGKKTTYANGGLLTPSMSAPWNSPGIWRELSRSLLNAGSAPVKVRLRALPHLAIWGISFLRNSRRNLFERNALSNLNLARRSLQVMAVIAREAALEYGHAARGTLRIFRDEDSFGRARDSATRSSEHGVDARVLTAKEVVDLEPALAPIARHLSGAVYYPGDQTGDARRFCMALARYAQRAGAAFYFSRDVHTLEVRGGRVVAARSNREAFVADHYVVAAGHESTQLLRSLGIKVPVQPLKGYSVTFKCRPASPQLRIPVVDDGLHAAVTPLEGAVRVAGTAEFAGPDLTLDSKRTRSLVALLSMVLPAHAGGIDLPTQEAWCGLRAMSCDGVPVIGSTPIPNLFVNSGHGHLGWTLAAGSAELLSAVILNGKPMVDPARYALSRFEAS